jgi:TfoX/Sxy family transcriptional regulator of competence genes
MNMRCPRLVVGSPSKSSRVLHSSLCTGCYSDSSTAFRDQPRQPRGMGSRSMPFNERLATRVRDVLAQECPAKERRMFGGLAFMVHGHMCCGIVGEVLVVRVGSDLYEQALSQPHARPMDFTGRSMKGLVFVDRPGYRTTKSLREWVRNGVRFVLSLPAK